MSTEDAKALIELSAPLAKKTKPVTVTVADSANRKSGRKTKRPARTEDWLMVDEGVAIFGPNVTAPPSPKLHPSPKKARAEEKTSGRGRQRQKKTKEMAQMICRRQQVPKFSHNKEERTKFRQWLTFVTLRESARGGVACGKHDVDAVA